MTKEQGEFKAYSPSLVGKKVLLLFPHIVNPGGALIYTLHLAAQLREAGARVAILTLRAAASEAKVPDGVDVLSLNGPLTSSVFYWLFYPYWQSKIDRAILQWCPDIIVPQAFPSNWWGWIFRRRNRSMKLVWVCHEPSAFIHSDAWIRALNPFWKRAAAVVLRPVLKKMDISLSKECDAVVANSRFTADEMKRVYAIQTDVIANPGVDFSASCPRVEPVPRQAVITVSKLTKFKRVDFLIDVFAELHQSQPDLQFHIVGKGEEEKTLRKQVETLGLGKNVFFLGAVEDQELKQLLQSSALYLHGSINEPFGMAPLEAIACGTPVVAHNSGGPKEFVTSERGLLIDSLDKKLWAEKISLYLHDVIADSTLRTRVRASARSFDWRMTLAPAIKTIGDLVAN